MSIVAGFGFRRGASPDSLRDAYQRARAGWPAVSRLATASDKAGAAALIAFAREMQLPVQAICAARIAAQPTFTQSPRVAALYGTGSLAEAAALAGAGPGAELLGPRVVSADRMASCALARPPKGQTP